MDSSWSCSNSDIDLESGEMITNGEDARKGQDLSSESSDNSSSRIRSKCMNPGSLSGSTSARENSCSYDHKMSNSNEIYYKNKEMELAKFKEEMESRVDKTMMIDRKTLKKVNAQRPARPPRHPRGPSLGSSDIMMLREISKINLKRRKMERIKTLKKVEKRKKASSLNSNLACFVTLIFFVMIILQGN
ncbi:hypothetical protein Salat_1528200 [Sesamum alatum]|uniref:Uncharacterized protein n=1 Tax=Sesamum alatum TaxID=300844 RepID=A0AAE2CMH1_9LAMI|nr:hypothetical protein Salat_1528200 [Sesamum alatum]